MKKILAFLLIFILPLSVYANELDLAPTAKGAIIMEASSGQIIYEKNPHQKLAPASMTKIMTMLLIIEDIEKGSLALDERIRASAEASGMGGTQIYLETGEIMSVEDLFKGIAIASANDAAVAMAERIAGTEQAFVNRMNKRAQAMGLKNTNFKNCHGLDEDNHYSTPYDIAMMARELVKHEIILKFTSIYEDNLRSDTDRRFWLVNTNKLLLLYHGVDGLKTGFTDAAGSCLTVTAKKDNMRLIGVLMGYPDVGSRNTEAIKMLDYGYNQYTAQTLLAKNSHLGKVEIDKGKKKYAQIIAMDDAIILNKKGDGARKNITYDLKITKTKAPLKVGEKVGVVIIKYHKKVIAEVDITVQEDVKRATIFNLYLRYLSDLFVGDLNF